MTDVYETVRTALTDNFNIPDDLVSPTATLEELEMDSLALAEFTLILQEQLGVKIAGEHATKSTTLGEVVSFLEARRAMETVTR
jgi:acyl carrier protein